MLAPRRVYRYDVTNRPTRGHHNISPKPLLTSYRSNHRHSGEIKVQTRDRKTYTNLRSNINPFWAIVRVTWKSGTELYYESSDTQG